MDAELAALIEERKRQAQMLKDLGLMDDDEETPQEEEQEQTELAELDQMLNEPEPIKTEEPKQEPQEEVTGKVSMTREGYAFIIRDGFSEDIFVSSRKLRGALHNDIVNVAVTVKKGRTWVFSWG